MKQNLENNVILCVEDDPDIRTFACRVLELEGYVCLHTENPIEAIKIIKDQVVNLVLLDLRLVEKDGWSLLGQIKSNPETAGIPVIVCTASYAISQKERALRMGAAEYLIKPLSTKVLKDTVSRFLPLK